MIIMLLYETKYFVEKIEIRKNMLKDLTVSLKVTVFLYTLHSKIENLILRKKNLKSRKKKLVRIVR